MKIFIKIIVSVIIIGILYFVLAMLDLAPVRHCDSAMGPNGLVRVCEWYRGPFVERDY